jgi:hypothetical protein
MQCTRRTPLPKFEPDILFKDNDGNHIDAFELNTHTSVIGASGGGKTHLASELIIQCAPFKGWNYGWVRAIMPKGASAQAVMCFLVSSVARWTCLSSPATLHAPFTTDVACSAAGW